MDLPDHIREIESAAGDASRGLPEDIFLMTTRLTPMINVDLLIKTPEGVLLTWREDRHFVPGWHIPGGIIRFMEKIDTRLDAVAFSELGATLKKERKLLNIHEFFYPELSSRNHFISLLYEVELSSEVTIPRCTNLTAPKHGEYAFFRTAPENLLEPHEIYRKFLEVTESICNYRKDGYIS